LLLVLVNKIKQKGFGIILIVTTGTISIILLPK